MNSKFFIYNYILFVILSFSACSNERLEDMGIIKKKANQYAVSRKVLWKCLLICI